MSMKIYVVYTSIDYEGCSDPIAAFSTKEKAQELMDMITAKHSKWVQAKMTELTLDEWPQYV